MRSNTAIDDKLQGETRDYSFDWTPYLADGDTIDGEPAAIVALYGSATVDVNTVAEGVQTFRLSGGTVGRVALQLEIATAGEEILQQVVTLAIL